MLASLGQLLHVQFANERRFGPNDVWLPDRDDHTYIAGSIANIIARRVPDGLGEDSDLGDLIVAGIATGGYAAKNTQKRAQLVRRAKVGAWSEAERGEPAASSSAAGFAPAAGGGAL